MMRVAPTSSTVPLLLSVLAAVLVSGSCQSELVAPDAPATAPAAREASAHSTAQHDGNQPPTAVFKTTPLANDESVITGGHALDVTFNLCQSSDPDEGDELRFWFDYDGDGKQDEYGHCRATHHYQVKEFDSACVFTSVCVSDRQPDHAVCHTYQVCTVGKPRPAASPSEPGPSPSDSPGPSPTPEPTPTPGAIEQHEDGDFGGPSSKDIWSFTTSAATDVTVKLDTVSQSTAYIMSACVSTSTLRRDCVTPTFKDRVACAFHNPLRIGCPVRSYSLSNAGTYYLIVNGFRPGAQEDGQYTIAMTAHPGAGALNLESNNVAENPFLEQ